MERASMWFVWSSGPKRIGISPDGLPSLVEKDPVASAAYCFRRSPPRPSPFGGVLEVLTTGLRVLYNRIARTLLTLTPALPSRLASLPSGVPPPDILSWGCPKISPPSFRAEESDAQRTRRRVHLRGGAAALPACRPRGFSPPRRFLLFDRAGLLRPASDPGVHHVSACLATRLPVVRSCPSKSSPRRQRRAE